jgi:transposase
MERPQGIRPVLGLDVGKFGHWACLLDEGGRTVASRPVANDRGEFDSLFASVPERTLVVVDQARNIGALALRRARAAGLDTAYLPGIAAHNAARMYPGVAKNDERDAWVIASTAQGLPRALSAAPDGDPLREAARAYGAQIDFLTGECTRVKNRIRGVLLDTHPDFERVLDLGNRAVVDALAAFGGPSGILAAGKPAFGARTKGADRGRMDALWTACEACERLDPALERAQDLCLMSLASSLRSQTEALDGLEAELARLLKRDECYRCLLTVPGVGPKTASALVASIDIARFEDHDHLASYCGLAPADRQSGTSVRSVHASAQGNRRLKNLLIFSCNSLVRGDSVYGRYYRKKRDGGKRHNDALKATARYRLKVIYAVMRDCVPYRDPRAA